MSTTTAVTIVRSGPDDAGEILTLQRAAWVSEARANGITDIPPLTETLDELRTDLASHHVLVARDGHRLVGTVRARAVGSVWHIGRLGVVPDRVGTGLGSQLLAAIEAAAPEQIETFTLFTGPRSAHNLAFYPRRGYRPLDSDDELAHFSKPRSAAPSPSPAAPPAPDDPPTAPDDTDAARSGPGRVLAVDHVGIAVRDLDAAIRFWGAVFGAQCVLTETNADQRVQEAMLALPGGSTQLQLLAPAAEDSTIARFLERHGPGVQQLAVTVDDVEQTAGRLREHGLRVLYDTPRPGTAGSRVNFVHPKDTGGVLVELVEPAHG